MRFKSPLAASSIAFNMVAPMQTRVPSVRVPCDRIFVLTSSMASNGRSEGGLHAAGLMHNTPC